MYQVRYKEKITRPSPYNGLIEIIGNINVLVARHKTQEQAETFKSIEYTQMEMADSKGELYIIKEKTKRKNFK